MPLPTGPIPRVAVGEIIEENWGDSVAQSLNNLTEMIVWRTWSPATGDEYFADNDGLMTQWFAFGAGGTDPLDFYVPTWARDALVTVTIAGIQYDPPGATARTSYLMQTRLGGLTGKLIRYSGQGGWFGTTWSDRFLDIEDVVGDRILKVFAQRLEGSAGSAGPPAVEASRWNLSPESDVAVSIIYSGGIRFYPDL